MYSSFLVSMRDWLQDVIRIPRFLDRVSYVQCLHMTNAYVLPCTLNLAQNTNSTENKELSFE